jgi:hypothetical protein
VQQTIKTEEEFTMKLSRLIITAAFAALSANAYAQVPLGELHRHFDPRQGKIEIENRLHHQGERIFRKLRVGLISPDQAAMLRGEDEQVRRQMRVMEERHGGFLTPDDRMVLNHRLDDVSRQIGV